MKTIFLMYTKYISEFKISPEDRKISFSFAVCRLKKTNYLYSCLNVKELLARNSEIRSLSDCNWTRTQKHLVRKRTLNHLAKLSNWLSCALSTYLYGAFDCMHHTDKYWEHSSIIWPIWPNGWVFVYELSSSGFESSCSHLKTSDFAPALRKEFLDIQATIECGFTLNTRTWHHKNILSNAPYR